MTPQVDARPFALDVPIAAAALLVVDMQHEFLTEGGFASALGRDLEQVRGVIGPVQRSVRAARRLGMRVVYTRESHRPGLEDCPPAKWERSRRAGAEIGAEGPLGRRLVRGEKGNQLVPEMDVREDDLVIDKPGKGAFHATDLDLVLRTARVTHLFVAGVSTNVCVNTTVREANDHGYWPLLLEDACAAYTQRMHEAAIEMIGTGGGVLGWVTSVAKLEDLSQTATTETTNRSTP